MFKIIKSAYLKWHYKRLVKIIDKRLSERAKEFEIEALNHE